MRPASESSSQEQYMARWYETFVTACQTAKQRGLGLICHPSHKSAMMDMMERVAEDPIYTTKFGRELPHLVFYSQMPEGEFRFIDEKTRKTLTFTEAMKTNRGMGRIRKMYTPDESLRKRN